jgi:hypothetical protein
VLRKGIKRMRIETGRRSVTLRGIGVLVEGEAIHVQAMEALRAVGG